MTGTDLRNSITLLAATQVSYPRMRVSIFIANVDSRSTPSREQALRGNDK